MDQHQFPNDESPALSARQGFEAMYHFLEAYWQRGRCTADKIAILLGEIDCRSTSEGGPADPAQWSDWLDAVGKVKSGN